jgi:hypothetical protein
MCELDELLTDTECARWSKDNFERMLRTAKYLKPLSRITAQPVKPNPADYWKSAVAKAIAEQESK